MLADASAMLSCAFDRGADQIGLGRDALLTVINIFNTDFWHDERGEDDIVTLLWEADLSGV